MLVLRLPEQRRAAAALADTARATVRSNDLVAYDPQSAVCLLAIVDDRGVRKAPTARICRAVLQRICARFAAGHQASVDSGWTLVRSVASEGDLRAAIGCALERGAHERQRYDFLAVVGHELRTPLASIRAHLETLLRGDLDTPTAHRFLHTARHETLRMARLLDSAFEFSLLEFSSTADALGCDLSEAARAACAVLMPLAEGRGIVISNRLRRAVWAALDPDACFHAFVNLLDNAVKYARRNGCVRVSATRYAAWVRVAVEDDGPGVAPGDRQKIFGLRVQGAYANRPGTGIGLAIVALIAQRAGGDVRVTRSALGGARFVLRLPLKAECAQGVS